MEEGKKKNSRLPRHVIAILAPKETDQTRDVSRLARSADKNQVSAVFLDRVAFGRALLLSKFFVDEIPLDEICVSVPFDCGLEFNSTYHRCTYDAWRVGVDGDVLFGQFHGVG